MAEKLCDLRKKGGSSGGSWEEKTLTLTNLTAGKYYVLFLTAYTTPNLTITGGTVLMQEVKGGGYGLAFIKATATTVTVTSGAAASPMKIEITLD